MVELLVERVSNVRKKRRMKRRGLRIKYVRVAKLSEEWTEKNDPAGKKLVPSEQLQGWLGKPLGKGDLWSQGAWKMIFPVLNLSFKF